MEQYRWKTFCAVIYVILHNIVQNKGAETQKELPIRLNLELKFDSITVPGCHWDLSAFSGSSKQCNLLIGICLSNELISSTIESNRHNSNNMQSIHNVTPSDMYAFKTKLVVLPNRCEVGQEQIKFHLDASLKLQFKGLDAIRMELVTVPLRRILLNLNVYYPNDSAEPRLLGTLQHLLNRFPGNTWSPLMLNTNPSNPVPQGIESPDTDPDKDRQTISEAGFINLTMRYRYTCRKNYYGPNCNHFCEPQDSSLGHYDCHSQTGSLICKRGWTGARCTEAMCPDGCIHGVCDVPNHCSCLDGWTGPACNRCLPIPGCLNGACYYNEELADYEPYTCRCFKGWIGMLCNIDENFCGHSSSRCLNGGKCVNQAENTGSRPVYKCVCLSGFTGTHCEVVQDGRGKYNMEKANKTGKVEGPLCETKLTPCPEELHSLIDPTKISNISVSRRTGKNKTDNVCTEKICLNGGRCAQHNGNVSCICPPKFNGDYCETPATACRVNSCSNGGECLDGSTYFSCHCPFGWTGPFCRENLNECSEFPKLTGQALCKNGAGCRDLLGSYQCLCQPGWTGEHCERRIELCSSNDTKCSKMRKYTPGDYLSSSNDLSWILVVLGFSLMIVLVATVSISAVWCIYRISRKKNNNSQTDHIYASGSCMLNNTIRDCQELDHRPRTLFHYPSTNNWSSSQKLLEKSHATDKLPSMLEASDCDPESEIKLIDWAGSPVSFKSRIFDTSYCGPQRSMVQSRINCVSFTNRGESPPPPYEPPCFETRLYTVKRGY